MAQILSPDDLDPKADDFLSRLCALYNVPEFPPEPMQPRELCSVIPYDDHAAMLESETKIQMIALENIVINKLERDRASHLDLDLDDLKASILQVGLSNPIRVEPNAAGKFELVQGWRRLSAYRALRDETGEARFATIPALLMQDCVTIEALYRRMVDENMVRKDISWAEMARLTLRYIDEPRTQCRDLDLAVNLLFASASPQKRSYIRRFADLMQRLEKVLEHPEAIPRGLGIELSMSLQSDPDRLIALCKALNARPRRDVQTELEILRCFAGRESDDSAPTAYEDVSDFPAGKSNHLPKPKSSRGRPPKRPGAMVRLDLLDGAVTCALTPGRVEIWLDHDFTTLPRPRLESAILAFYAALR